MEQSVFSSVAQAVTDSLTSIATLSLSLRFGAVFYKRFLFKHNVRNHETVQRLFEWTFALSLSLILLIIFDAVGLMHGSTRRINWLLNVYALVLTLLVILPPAQVYHILIDSGWKKRRALRAACASEVVFLFLFWRAVVPPFSTMAAAQAASASNLSIESAMTRLLIIGTTLLAVLSGFSAVHLPYVYLSALIHPVSEPTVNSLAAKLRNALDDVTILKRQQLDQQMALARRNAAQKQHQHPHGNASASTARSTSGFISISNSYSPEVSNAERTASALFVKYNEASAQWKDVVYARTPLGRLSTLLGGLMLLLCFIRVVFAIYNIFVHLRILYPVSFSSTSSLPSLSLPSSLSSLSLSHSSSSSSAGGASSAGSSSSSTSTASSSSSSATAASSSSSSSSGLDATSSSASSSSSGGGAPPSASSTRTTALLSTSLHRILVGAGVQVDVSVVYQYSTLLFTSVLLVTNLRAVLLRMTAVFALLAGHDGLSSSAAIFLAHLMGTYVISSTILMRSFLPPGSRFLIADVVGTMEFVYFQRWFDIIFLSSAALATVVLAYQAGYLTRLSATSLARGAAPGTAAAHHAHHAHHPMHARGAAGLLSAVVAVARHAVATGRRAWPRQRAFGAAAAPATAPATGAGTGAAAATAGPTGMSTSASASSIGRQPQRRQPPPPPQQQQLGAGRQSVWQRLNGVWRRRSEKRNIV